MNGPSFPQGEPVPKVEVSSQPTPEDEVLAKKFLTESRKFDGPFNQHKNHTARALGYASYDAMPLGVKSWISSYAAMVKKERNDEKIIMANEAANESVLNNLELMRQDYDKLFKDDPSFRHAKTHPDEERKSKKENDAL